MGLVSGKMYQIVITGEVPVSLLKMNPEEIGAVVTGGVTISLSLAPTVGNVAFNLADQPVPPPPAGN